MEVCLILIDEASDLLVFKTTFDRFLRKFKKANGCKVKASGFAFERQLTVKYCYRKILFVNTT